MEIEKMDIRALWRTTVMSLCVVCVFTNVSIAGDDNAIVGIVRSKKDKRPLGNVVVTLAQKTSVRDQTRSDDGIYLILVPESRKAIDILYEREGFLARSRPVDNEQKRQKVPVIDLIPVEEISELSTPELEKLVNEAIEMVEQGGGERNISKDVLVTAGYENLRKLRSNIVATTTEQIRLKETIERQLQRKQPKR